MKIYQDRFTHSSLLEFSALVDSYVVLINKKTNKARLETEEYRLEKEYANKAYGIRFGEEAYDFGVRLNAKILSDFQSEIDAGYWGFVEGKTLADKLLYTMSHLNTTFIIDGDKVIYVRNDRNVMQIKLPAKMTQFKECVESLRESQRIDWNSAKLYFNPLLGNFYISDCPELEFGKIEDFVEIPFSDNLNILEIKEKGKVLLPDTNSPKLSSPDTDQFDTPLNKKLNELLPKSTYSREDDDNAFGLTAAFTESGINFVAIDLETATSERDSICEVGIAIIENSKIKTSKSWLVQPPGNEYDDFNIEIHGIRPRDTKNCPEFSELWPEIRQYLDGRIVVSHNTAFDMYVLRDSFMWNDIPFPEFAFFCSYRASAKLVKGCYSYSLPNVCETLGIPFSGHHRAGNDAAACAEVFLKCIQLSGCNSFSELQQACEFRCGRFSDNYFRPQLSTHQGGKSFKIEDIKGNPAKIDEGSYFYGKRVCFTGTCIYGIRKDLLQKIADIGGIPMDSVTKSTDILIVGQQDYKKVGESGMSNKQKKAMALKDAGSEIEIMSEMDFLNNI